MSMTIAPCLTARLAEITKHYVYCLHAVLKFYFHIVLHVEVKELLYVISVLLG